jgi:hypothetical protein
MAAFELIPCKFRDHKVVPVRDEEVLEIKDFTSFLERFRVSFTHNQMEAIRIMRPDAFVGLIRGKLSGNPTFFCLANHDTRSNDFKWLLTKDPTIPNRVLEVFKVNSLEWDSGVQEKS